MKPGDPEFKGQSVWASGQAVPANPTSTPATEPPTPPQPVPTAPNWEPDRHRLPAERHSLTHKMVVDGQKGYITAGMYPDGKLGEVFIAGLGKEGSTQAGWINSWCIAFSHALQYGASLRSLARKYHSMRFEPNGPTDNPQIPSCLSIPDYVVKWLVLHFGDDDLKEELL